MERKSKSVAGERRRLWPMFAAGAFGVTAAWGMHALAHDVGAADGSANVSNPVRVESRYQDLGTLWRHELSSASFVVHNDSNQPFELVSQISNCATFEPFAATADGPEARFTSPRRLTVEPGSHCVVGARFTVHGAGETERLQLECLAVAGARSWPLQFTAEWRAEEAIVVEPEILFVDDGERLGHTTLRLQDGGAFAAVVLHDPDHGQRAFTAPMSDACTQWTVAVAAQAREQLSGMQRLTVDLVTPSRRRLKLQLPIAYQ